MTRNLRFALIQVVKGRCKVEVQETVHQLTERETQVFIQEGTEITKFNARTENELRNQIEARWDVRSND
jgi:hypothetical protein